jgi:hypothetical protein
MHKEVVGAYFEIVSQYFTGGNGKKHSRAYKNLRIAHVLLLPEYT